jgi:hypothetical protein
MAYVMIDDFAGGIDLRKAAITAPAGTLRRLDNAVISPGGEIQKRKTFSQYAELPAGTTGLAFDGENLVVFGLDVAPAIMPAYITYQRLLPTLPGYVLGQILDVQFFGGALYVIAQMDNGDVLHFYGGVHVPDTQVQGKSIYAHKKKLYATDGPNIRASALLNATDWTVGAGNMIIDVTTEDAAGTSLVATEAYFSYLALFGRSSIQLWSMASDPTQNQIAQTLGQIGLVARRGVARYGNGDVLFLSDTGIRSLRSRDSSNSASINDVGSPVDTLVSDRRAVLTDSTADAIRAFVDPLSGRFWLVWGSEVFVLSTFPNSNISAWSLFKVGATVNDAIVANSNIVLRVGNSVRVYGTLTNIVGQSPFSFNAQVNFAAVANYDATQAVAETPFMDAGRPATVKEWTALDMSVVGTWDVEVNPDPLTLPAKWIKVATVDKPTWGHGRVPIDMHSTHIAVRLTSTNTGEAKISNMAVHFNAGEAS